MINKSKRYSFLDSNCKLSLRLQAKLLGIPRGKYYYKPKRESFINIYIMNLIDKQYQRTPFYGVPRMTDYLNGLGLQPINKKRVERFYKLMDIRAIGPNPHTSKADAKAYKYPYLLRSLKIDHSNQVWAVDITYVGLSTGYMYLFAIIDIYSRLIIAWDISNSMTAKWCKSVVLSALEYYPTPDILNSDQGTQFTSDIWIDLLNDNGIKISMDGKGRAIDNIFIERFWRSYKYEYLYLKPPNGGKELYEGTKEYMDFYNFERQHKSLGKKTPAEYYYSRKVIFTPTTYTTSVV